MPLAPAARAALAAAAWLIVGAAAELGEQAGGCPQGCSSHGACKDGFCVCQAGWASADCALADPEADEELDADAELSALPLVAGAAPAAAAPTEAQFAACDPRCAAPTGRCVGGQCFCAPGFAGVDCSSPVAAEAGGAAQQQQELTPPQQQGVTAFASDTDSPEALDAMERQVAAMEAQLASLQATGSGAAAAPPPVAAPAPKAGPPAREAHAAAAARPSSNSSSNSSSGGARDTAGAPAAKSAGGLRSLLTSWWRRVSSAPSPPAPAKTAPTPPKVAQSKVQPSKAEVRRGIRDAGDAAARLHAAAAAKRHGVAHAAAPAAGRRATLAHGQERAARRLPLWKAAPFPRTAAVDSEAATGSSQHASAPRPAAAAPVAATVADRAAALAEDPDDEDSAVHKAQPPPADAAAAHHKLSAASTAHRARHGGAPSAELPPAPMPGSCWEDCSGHGSCGSGTCTCEQGWVGMACDTPTCPDDCNGHGRCVLGQCMCDEDWHGPGCAQRRCPDDCSGSGYCFEGVCQCTAGFGGANCGKVMPVGQKLSVKLHKAAPMRAPSKVDGFVETASLRGVAPPSCPNACNNRGTCNERGNCECMAGYSGNACEDFCPNECSHQGDCIEGACLCFAGFLGEDCSVAACCSGHGSCDDPDACQCEAGWGGEDCSVKKLCEDNTCSGHGACELGECKCDVGYTGASCSLLAGGCNPPCSPHGMCNPELKRCICEGGFTGETCAVAVQQCPNNCNNKGLCMNGECMCGAGWQGADCSARRFVPGETSADLLQPKSNVGIGANGPLSGQGTDGLHEASPTAAPASLLAVASRGSRRRTKAELAAWARAQAAAKRRRARPPSNATAPSHAMRGSARASAPSHGVALAQRGAYRGAFDSLQGVIASVAGVLGFDSPEEVAAKRLAPKGPLCGEGGACSGHGFCNTSFGKCECEGLWHGAACEVEGCHGFLETGKDCSGHGICQPGSICLCSAGYGKTVPQIDPAPGAAVTLVAPELNDCSERVCPVPCGDHGKCMGGTCVCEQGWQGPNCRDPQCPGACSGHGVCGQPSPNSPGECTCDYGWAGSACTRQALYEKMPACPLDCSGNGLCMNGMCVCNVGFSGAACNDVSCPPGTSGPDCSLAACPNECTGNGLCYNGKCSCFTGFAGDDCNLPERCIEPCRDVCAPAPASALPGPPGMPEASQQTSRCQYCIGACITAEHYPLGRHNPFDDLRATLIQAPGPGNRTAVAEVQKAASGLPRRQEQAQQLGGGRPKQHKKHKEHKQHRQHHEVVVQEVAHVDPSAGSAPPALPARARRRRLAHRRGGGSPRSQRQHRRHRRHREVAVAQPTPEHAVVRKVASSGGAPALRHQHHHHEVSAVTVRPAS